MGLRCGNGRRTQFVRVDALSGLRGQVRYGQFVRVPLLSVRFPGTILCESGTMVKSGRLGRGGSSLIWLEWIEMRVSGPDLLHRTPPQSGAHLHETETQRGSTARAKRNRIGLDRPGIAGQGSLGGELPWPIEISVIAARAIGNWVVGVEVALHNLDIKREVRVEDLVLVGRSSWSNCNWVSRVQCRTHGEEL
ncbi:hypothetical protein R1flu_004573 [Riccia fluitans]|uniref:Ribosomal protein L2 n=1 Tax=Riccia fluitans TaxID=41844 RepID=A0ABD1YQQ2_9MARC